MKSHVEVLTTHTSDTRGTCLVLEFADRRYLIGNAHEGCQRAFAARGKKLNKVSDIFLTGKVEWKNIGGLLGLMLTIADSRQAAKLAALDAAKTRRISKLARLDETISQSRPNSPARSRALEEKAEISKQRPEDGENKAGESLGIHGGPNLMYTVATARTFIFRKGMPLNVQETAVGAETQDWSPTWSDSNLQVWSMPVSPSSSAHGSRKRSYDDYLQKHDRSHPLSTPEPNQDIVRDVVGAMFDSNWRADGLELRSLATVQMPAEIFYQEPGGGVSVWKGPKPGEVPPEDLPNTGVLVRKPWPARSVHSLPPVEKSHVSMSYIFKNHPQRGKFLPSNAEKLGVPKKAYKILAGGESIDVNGRTILPEEVMAPGKVGSGFAVVELPSDDYVEPTLQRKEWASQKVMEGVNTIFWLLGPGVSDNRAFQDFVQEFKHLKHVVSSPDHTPNYYAYEGSTKMNLRLASIDPERFPVPVGSKSPAKPVPSALQSATTAHPGQVLHLEPRAAWDASSAMKTLDPFEAFSDTTDTVKDLCRELWADVNSPAVQGQIATQTLPGLDNEIITLGTGSSAPSKYRNVSATLLRVPGHGSYLFDAGENTLGQLARLYNAPKLKEVLRDLRLIWISHLHADHHLGLASVIKAWHEAKYEFDFKPGPPRPGEGETEAQALSRKKLAVVAPEPMFTWLSEYSLVEDIGMEEVASVPIYPEYDNITPDVANRQNSLTFNGSTPESNVLRDLAGLASLDSVPVSHCQGAAAVSMTFPDGFKISYSGDCRPSKRFAAVGRNSTVLIHEATFNDDLAGDALAKKHSTTSEAIGVGLAMKAPRILLTHFSQRYAKIPQLSTVRNQELAFTDIVNEAEDGGDNTVNSDDTTEVLEEIQANEDEVERGAPNVDSVAKEIASVPEQLANDAKGGFEGAKVAVAFDNMRVKVRDLAVLEKFNDIFGQMFDMKPDEKPETELKSTTGGELKIRRVAPDYSELLDQGPKAEGEPPHAG